MTPQVRTLDTFEDPAEALLTSHRIDSAAAVLHASEGSIYRRFGYGPATRRRGVRIDTARTRFRTDAPDPGGSLRLLQPADALGACSEVQDLVAQRTAGALHRDEQWWAIVLGPIESYLGGGPRRLVMVHHDERGAGDGYVIYEVHEDWSAHTASHTLSVWELVAARPAVEVALWRAMIDHDLVTAVTGPIAVDSVLWDVVDDPRHVAVQWEQDLLWIRLLDVERVLSQRRYQGSGQLVIDIEDPPLAGAGGRYLLEVDDGVGHCSRIGTADARSDLRVSMADLGSVVLGDRSFRRLDRAGRIAPAGPASLQLADQLFSADPLPWCWVRF